MLPVHTKQTLNTPSEAGLAERGSYILRLCPPGGVSVDG